ncbi:MAG: cation transporter [Nanoarchaeota archaeon]|nr:cation transporter [Nanoarchaeota archaeon]
MTFIEIRTKGMHCGSCEQLIKESLLCQTGIGKVNASHRSGTVTIDFDSEKIEAEEIKRIIKSEGYEVE